MLNPKATPPSSYFHTFWWYLWTPSSNSKRYVGILPHEWLEDDAHGQLVFPEMLAESLSDVYLTVNSLFQPYPLDVLTKRLNAAFVDLDCHRLPHPISGPTMWEHFEAVEFFNKRGIPQPSEVVASGGGLYLFWYLEGERTQAFRGNTELWRRIEKALVHVLREYGADPAATNPSRVLRPPGSVNSKHHAVVRVLYQADEYYTLEQIADALRVELAPVLKVPKPRGRPARNVSRLKFKYSHNQFSLYTLNHRRMADLFRLSELRGGFRKGHRDLALFYFCTAAIAVLAPQDVLEQAEHFNAAFTPPLKDSEVKKVVGYAVKSDRPRKFARTPTIIDTLEISINEQEELGCLVSGQVRAFRFQQALQFSVTGKRIMAAFDERPGITQRALADSLNVSQATVSRALAGAGRVPNFRQGRPKKAPFGSP